MKYTTLIASIAILILSACSSKTKTPIPAKIVFEKPTAAKEAKFNSVMHKVALSTRENERYNRMALDTPEKKSWFKTLMYRLWDRQITRKEFITEGLTRYPKHSYEFNYIANGFQRF
jgi:uncharacterized protein YcfL